MSTARDLIDCDRRVYPTSMAGSVGGAEDDECELVPDRWAQKRTMSRVAVGTLAGCDKGAISRGRVTHSIMRWTRGQAVAAPSDERTSRPSGGRAGAVHRLFRDYADAHAGYAFNRAAKLICHDSISPERSLCLYRSGSALRLRRNPPIADGRSRRRGGVSRRRHNGQLSRA
uniref:Uncharacterized protein n=1 Tax=Plectus sambesii TaxID=2011161 RepID=A0A914W2R2_9BILA